MWSLFVWFTATEWNGLILMILINLHKPMES